MARTALIPVAAGTFTEVAAAATKVQITAHTRAEFHVAVAAAKPADGDQTKHIIPGTREFTIDDLAATDKVFVRSLAAAEFGVIVWDT